MTPEQEGRPCDHCGLPSVFARSSRAFCCSGCEVAFNLLNEHGLANYYTMAEQLGGARPAPRRDKPLRFDGIDAPELLQRFTREQGGIRTATFALRGLRCAACVWLLEKLPRVLPGVVQARVNWHRATIEVHWRDASVQTSDVAHALDKLGYEPVPQAVDVVDSRAPRAARAQWIALGVAGAAAGNNMLIAIALYLGWFSSMAFEHTQLLRVASCLVGAVSVFGPGRSFLRGAYAALRTRTPHMDLPIALGLVVGMVAGVVNTIRGTGEVYFDTLSVLVFLLLIGRWLQERQQAHAARTVELLHRLTPHRAHLIDGDARIDTPSELLQPGNLVLVPNDTRVPADGDVEWGHSHVNEMILTGETHPRAVKPGDWVHAGTTNGSGALHLRVRAVGDHTRVGHMMALIEQASQRRPHLVQRADRLGATFVVVVLALAVLTFAGWLAIDAAQAVDHAVALLIVACPCALALATPLALTVGLGIAAQHHVLIRTGDVFERLQHKGHIWLDKTGTLTEGNMRVHAWLGSPHLQSAVAALEQDSRHPVGCALAAYAPPGKHVLTDVSFQQGGVRGIVDGITIMVGNAAFLERNGIVVDAFVSVRRKLGEQGWSAVFVASQGQIQAVVGLGDTLRPGVGAQLQRLQARGFTLGILSGDDPAVVHAVATAVGIDPHLQHGGLSPENKADIVANTAGTTIMVGDGVNDSAALAAASVGIATHQSAEVCLQAAPVYLAEPGLEGVHRLLDVAERTLHTVHRNFRVSLGYNAVCITLAMFGVVNPLVAALLMPLSSLTVVASSLSARFVRLAS